MSNADYESEGQPIAFKSGPFIALNEPSEQFSKKSKVRQKAQGHQVDELRQEEERHFKHGLELTKVGGVKFRNTQGRPKPKPGDKGSVQVRHERGSKRKRKDSKSEAGSNMADGQAAQLTTSGSKSVPPDIPGSPRKNQCDPRTGQIRAKVDLDQLPWSSEKGAPESGVVSKALEESVVKHTRSRVEHPKELGKAVELKDDSLTTTSPMKPNDSGVVSEYRVEPMVKVTDEQYKLIAENFAVIKEKILEVQNKLVEARMRLSNCAEPQDAHAQREALNLEIQELHGRKIEQNSRTEQCRKVAEKWEETKCKIASSEPHSKMADCMMEAQVQMVKTINSMSGMRCLLKAWSACSDPSLELTMKVITQSADESTWDTLVVGPVVKGDPNSAIDGRLFQGNQCVKKLKKAS
ncbi:hypothetical protein HDE_09496 [Halotydeus destructor]|nr:hypothetical protein HDE_09496 [Halotydeus destructor]